MKCIFVGVFHERSTNYSQANALESIGIEVERYEYRKIAKKLSPEKRDFGLKYKICNERPDFVLYAKANGVDVSVINSTHEITKNILWYPDTLNSSFNDELIEKIKACHATCCAWQGPTNWAGDHTKKVCTIPEGYDPLVDRPIPNSNYKCNVSFIGSVDKGRKPYIKAYPMDVFENVYGKQHAEVACQSRININLTRKGGTSDRVYKIMAANGFLLTQKWVGMEFKPDVECGVFIDWTDMLRKIDYYLENDKIREQVKVAGHMAVRKYTRKYWAENMLGVVGSL